jgi:hypothetical protein
LLEQNDSETSSQSQKKSHSPSRPSSKRSQALEGVFKNYKFDLTKLEQNGDSIFKALNQGISLLKTPILQDLTQKLSIKIYASLELNFHLSTDTSYITDPPVVFNTEAMPILESVNIAQVLENIYQSFNKKIEQFSLQGSGWVLHYQPLQASATFELPKEIHDKKSSS